MIFFSCIIIYTFIFLASTSSAKEAEWSISKITDEINKKQAQNPSRALEEEIEKQCLRKENVGESFLVDQLDGNNEDDEWIDVILCDFNGDGIFDEKPLANYIDDIIFFQNDAERSSNSSSSSNEETDQLETDQSEIDQIPATFIPSGDGNLRTSEDWNVNAPLYEPTDFDQAAEVNNLSQVDSGCSNSYNAHSYFIIIGMIMYSLQHSFR